MITPTKPLLFLVILSSFLLSVAESQYEDEGFRNVKFNYNPNSNIGPEKWSTIDTSKSEYNVYFGTKKNTCDGKMQSPINIEPQLKCHDDHRVHFTRGTKNFDSIQFQILPGALRAKLPETGGPTADFSNLSLFIPAIHVEVKLKSEHHLFGKQYDGELTIVHKFSKQNSLVIAAIMMEKGHAENPMLELFIREWEEKARLKLMNCQGKDYTRQYDYPSSDTVGKAFGANRNWQVDYELYKLLPTIWYCGYEGSITVPPCSENVHWRVYDLPIQISTDQFKRIKKLLSKQLDGNCEKSSTSYRRMVNRPLQKNKLSKVWCCDSSYWRVESRDIQHYDGVWDWPKGYHGFKEIIYNTNDTNIFDDYAS